MKKFGGFPERRSDKIVSGGFWRKSGLELQISGLPISALGWLGCFLIVYIERERVGFFPPKDLK